MIIENKIVQLRDQIEQILTLQTNDSNNATDMDIDTPDVASLLAEIESELERLGTFSSKLSLDDLQRQNSQLKEVFLLLLVYLS